MQNSNLIKLAIASLTFVALYTEKGFSATQQEKAEQAYNNGQCEKAVQLYKSLRETGKLSDKDKDMATFRIAYCSYNLGATAEAAEEFESILRKYPEEDEARLRYAESLMAEEQYEEAIKQATMVKDQQFFTDAQLLIARSYIELQDVDKAMPALDAVAKDSSMEAVVQFWRGLAYFQTYDETAAENAFRKSAKNSPQDYWTKSASINWLKTLADSKRWVHARAGAAYGYDSNVAQYTYKTSRTSSPDRSYYVGDQYWAYDALLSAKAFRFSKFSLVPSLSWSLQKYADATNKSYNSSTLTEDLTMTYAASYKWTLRSSLSYTDFKYDNSFYRSYLSAKVSAFYALSKRASAYATLEDRVIGGGGGANSLGPTVGLEGDTDYFYWLASVGYANQTGKKAVYSSSSGSVTSGTLGNSYSSMTVRGGLGKVLPWGFDLLGMASYSLTSYAKEDIPSSAAYSTDKRQDKSWTLQATLSKALIERRLTLIGSYSYTKTSSEGFQGLSYTSGSPDYNVDRSLASVYLSYGF